MFKRLKDHVDINYVVPTEMVKSKKGEKEIEQRNEDLMLLKFLSNANALQLNLYCSDWCSLPN